MKRLMTAAAAVTLMCGVSAFAYAQDSQPATTGTSSSAAPDQGSMSPGSTASPPQGTDQSGQAPQGPMNGGPAPSTGDQGGAPPPAAGDQGGAMPGGSAPPPTGGASDAGAAPGGMTANAPDGAPPSSYPVCTSKGQDRCMQSGKMMEADHPMAKGHHHHMKAHHHHHHMKAKVGAPAASPAPAAAPAPGA